MSRWPAKSKNLEKSLPIPFYDEYYLTEDFKVVGKTGRLLSEIDTDNIGYKFVNVRVNKKNSILYIHRAVALVHVPGYFDGAFVDQIDGNPKNYQPENLRWVTPSQNTRAIFDCDEYKLKRVRYKIRNLEALIKKAKIEEQILMDNINK